LSTSLFIRLLVRARANDGQAFDPPEADGLCRAINAGLNPVCGRLLSAPMKLLFGAVPFLVFAAVLVAGIVRAANGSSWLLIVSSIAFVGLMLKCCLPVKH
jgi:hypothetical protein